MIETVNKYLKKVSKDILHYFPLLLVLVIGGVMLIFYSYNPFFQAIVAAAITFFYVVWGIVHHLVHKDLDAVVVIEYVLVASLGLIIIFSMLFNV